MGHGPKKKKTRKPLSLFTFFTQNQEPWRNVVKLVPDHPQVINGERYRGTDSSWSVPIHISSYNGTLPSQSIKLMEKN